MHASAFRNALAALVALAPALALPCSLRQFPNNVESLGSGQPVPSRLDGGSDAVAPAKPALSGARVTLVRGPCDGRGAACPQPDSVRLTVSTGDAQTPVERLRYVAAFGATAAEASAAAPSLLFEADDGAATQVTSWLGVNRRRSGVGFDRQALCFTLSAVDDAANVSERSDALCLDTTDERAATTTLVDGSPCGLGLVGCGCGAAGGALPLALGALALLAARRRRAR